MTQQNGRSHPEQISYEKFRHGPQVADHIITLVPIQMNSFSEVTKNLAIREVFEMDYVLSCEANFFERLEHLLEWMPGMTASDLGMLGPFEEMIVNFPRDFNTSLLCHRLNEMSTIAMRHMPPLISGSRLNSVCSFS